MLEQQTETYKIYYTLILKDSKAFPKVGTYAKVNLLKLASKFPEDSDIDRIINIHSMFSSRRDDQSYNVLMLITEVFDKGNDIYAILSAPGCPNITLNTNDIQVVVPYLASLSPTIYTAENKCSAATMKAEKLHYAKDLSATPTVMHMFKLIEPLQSDNELLAFKALTEYSTLYKIVSKAEFEAAKALKSVNYNKSNIEQPAKSVNNAPESNQSEQNNHEIAEPSDNDYDDGYGATILSDLSDKAVYTFTKAELRDLIVTTMSATTSVIDSELFDNNMTESDVRAITILTSNIMNTIDLAGCFKSIALQNTFRRSI
jgi:hypothetical protein